MVILRTDDIRKLTDAEMEKKLEELTREILDVGSTNPGRRRELKKAIARLYTVVSERKTKNVIEKPVAKPKPQKKSQKKQS